MRHIDADITVRQIESRYGPNDQIEVWKAIEMIESTPTVFINKDEAADRKEISTPFTPPFLDMDCNECGRTMIREWETYHYKDDACTAVAVYHCDRCDNDVELTRRFDKNNRLVSIHPHRFYFG